MDDFDGFSILESGGGDESAGGAGGDDFAGFDLVDDVGAGETAEQQMLRELLDPFVETGQLSPDLLDQLVESWDDNSGDQYDNLWEIDYEAPDAGDGYV